MLLFLDFNLDNRPNVFQSVSLRGNELLHDLFTKQIEIHTIELRKLDIEKGLNNKSIWPLLFSMKNESELKKVREYSDVMANIIDEMVEFSREEAESLYRTQVETYEMDVISRIEISKVRGIKQGKEEGIMLTAKKLKEANASVEMIMKATDLK